MDQKRIQLETLLEKVADGNASETEKEIVRRWLHSLDIPDNEVSEEILLQAKQQMLQSILGVNAPAVKIVPLRKIWRIAAAAAAVIAALIIGRVWLFSYFTPVDHHTSIAANISIKSDSIVKYIKLPDGSVVWLNAHSSLDYDPHSFEKRERNVHLEGEAYFEIQRNPSRPFIVSSGNITTRVLGTGFNVQTYSKDATVKITLVSGSIAVDECETGKTVLLKPSQQLQYAKNHKEWRVVPVNYNPAQNWMTGKLVFREASLAEVLDDIGHHYNVNVIYDKRLVLNKKVTTDISIHNKLETALNSVLFVHHLQYALKDGAVYISRN